MFLDNLLEVLIAKTTTLGVLPVLTEACVFLWWCMRSRVLELADTIFALQRWPDSRRSNGVALWQTPYQAVAKVNNTRERPPVFGQRFMLVLTRSPICVYTEGVLTGRI